MRNIRGWSLVLLCWGMLMVDAVFAEEDHQGPETGIIHYQVSMGPQTGTMKVYFQDYGRQQARYVHLNQNGQIPALTRVDYLDGDWEYNYDPATGNATRVAVKDMRYQTADGGIVFRMGKLRKEDLQEYAVLKGNRMIAGKPCNQWEWNNGEVAMCLYQDRVPLFSQMQTEMFSMTWKAVSFQENVDIPQDKMRLPSSAKIVTTSSSIEAMGWPNARSSSAQQPRGQPKDVLEEADQILNKSEKAKRLFGRFKRLLRR